MALELIYQSEDMGKKKNENLNFWQLRNLISTEARLLYSWLGLTLFLSLVI